MPVSFTLFQPIALLLVLAVVVTINALKRRKASH